MAGEDEQGAKKGADATAKTRSARRAEGGCPRSPRSACSVTRGRRSGVTSRPRAEEAAARARGADRPAGRSTSRCLGAGAQGQVLTDAMLRIPGLRFRAVCDIWDGVTRSGSSTRFKKFKHEVNGVRRLPRDARQGERARRGRSSRRPTSGTRSTRSTASRQASTSTARRRCRTRSRARAAWCCRRSARRASSCRSATSAARTRATCTATTS